MATTFKTFDQALAELALAYWGALGLEPDLVEGSVERSLLEAVAFQVSDLSNRMDRALRSAIPEAVFRAAGFARRDAQKASLTLRFTGLEGSTIPQGAFAATSDGTEFTTTSEATIATAATTVDVQAIAVNGGATGNVSIGAVTRLASNLSGVNAVTNITKGEGGKDIETLAEQQARFAEYLTGLDKTSIPAITLALLAVKTDAGEKLDQVLVVDKQDDPAIPAGTLHYYPYRDGGVSTDLSNALLKEALACRAAGVVVEVKTITSTSVNVTADLATTESGATAAVEAAAADYFANLRIGQKASRENLITVLTTAHEGIAEVTLTAPAADVPATQYEKLELGTLAITETPE